MAIATKTGDAGETDLNGERVKKHHPRLAAIGSVDELNSVIGIARNYAKPAMNDVLHHVQHDLFTLSAELAKYDKKTTQEMIDFLDKAIETIEPQLPKQTEFILPDGGLAASHLHFARTVCRRAERDCTKLNDYEEINPLIRTYLNRLSDVLHIFARAETKKEEKAEYK